MKKPLFFALIFLIIFSGCIQTPAQESVNASLGRSFELKLGQTAVLESKNLEIKFLELVGDSRCPYNVQCIWAGEAKVKLNFSDAAGNSGDFNLTLVPGGEEQASVNFGGYSIKLLKVEPNPSDKNSAAKESTVTLVVSKNN